MVEMVRREMTRGEESTLRRLITSSTSRKAQIWNIISEGIDRMDLCAISCIITMDV